MVGSFEDHLAGREERKNVSEDEMDEEEDDSPAINHNYDSDTGEGT